MKNDDLPAGSTGSRGAVVGSGPANPAPLGTVVRCRIERGDPYSMPRAYRLEIALREVFRGAAARWPLGELPGRPREGFEYLLARVEVGYFALGRAGEEDDRLALTERHFASASGDGSVVYEPPAAGRLLPGGLLGRVLAPGETAEGWVLLEVPEGEFWPLMVFRRERAEGVYGLFGDVYFCLFA